MIVTRIIDGVNLGIAEVDTLTDAMIGDGYCEVVTTPEPTPTDEQALTGVFVPNYTMQDGKMVQAWEWAKDNQTIEMHINQLKQRLTDTDYYVVKTYEARLFGNPDPYDAETLADISKQRNEWRAQVDKLLSLLQ